MRVIWTQTGEFHEIDPADYPYAILSHTWEWRGEQTYQELKKIQERQDRYFLQGGERHRRRDTQDRRDEQSPPVAATNIDIPPSASPSSPSSSIPLLAEPTSSYAAPLNEHTALLIDHAAQEEQPISAGGANTRQARLQYLWNRLLQLLLLITGPIASFIVLVGDVPIPDSPVFPPEPVPAQTAPAPPARPTPPRNVINKQVIAPAKETFPYPPISSSSDPRSHRWPMWSDPELSPKIRMACLVAYEAGYRYIWIDSCCIDKTSSSEVSEAINSMYSWYGTAAVCYVYLSDVGFINPSGDPMYQFKDSRWFERGWTLQELLAPFEVQLLNHGWLHIGSKHDLLDAIHEITRIPCEALMHLKPIEEFSVAQRFSWAAKRVTTRTEDKAYSLMGLFDIHMPTLYGEGTHALRRLLEEVMRRNPDQSLFAWGPLVDKRVHQRLDTGSPGVETPGYLQYYLLGDGKHYLDEDDRGRKHVRYPKSQSFCVAELRDFTEPRNSDISYIPREEIARRLQLSSPSPIEYTFTPHGIRTQFHVLPLLPYCSPLAAYFPGFAAEGPHWYFAILGCEHSLYPGCLLGRLCRIPPSQSGVDFLYAAEADYGAPDVKGPLGAQLFPLSPATLTRYLPQIELKTVYLPHLQSRRWSLDVIRQLPFQEFHLVLLKKTRESLRAQGYTVEFDFLRQKDPQCYDLTLSHYDHKLHIKLRHRLLFDGQRLEMDVHVASQVLLPEAANNGEATCGTRPFTEFGRTLVFRATKPWKTVFKGETAGRVGERNITVKIGFTLVGLSRYLLDVEVSHQTTPASSVGR